MKIMPQIRKHIVHTGPGWYRLVYYTQENVLFAWNIGKFNLIILTLKSETHTMVVMLH